MEVGIRLPARVCGERDSGGVVLLGVCREQSRAGQGVDAVGSVRSSSAVQLDY